MTTFGEGHLPQVAVLLMEALLIAGTGGQDVLCLSLGNGVEFTMGAKRGSCPFHHTFSDFVSGRAIWIVDDLQS